VTTIDETDGRYGSLHVKGAIVDDHHLFISSANLTEYALSLNIELGVLIQSEALVTQLKGQLESMVREKVIVPLRSPA
jgi:phosphatidylserine/phosphatidylglycerophosphate/cardiolipin synthase-like enzyme